jgi:hypothetical protein
MLYATAHWKATGLLHNQQKFHKIPQKITITLASCLDHQKAILVYKDLYGLKSLNHNFFLEIDDILNRICHC